MIFSVEITPIEAQAMETQSVQNCLNRLLQAHRDGKILLLFNRTNSNWFLENISLHLENRLTLERIIFEIPTTLYLKHNAYHKVVIVSNAENYTSTINIKYIELEINKIIASIERPVLVVENLFNDGLIIEFIIKNIIRRNNIPNYSMDIHSGAGSEVHKTALFHKDRGRITIAITDQDRLFPSSSLEMMSYDNDFYLYKLPCHEIENLLGIECLKCYSGIDSDMIRTIELLQQIDIKESGCIDPYFIYFDLKKGVSSASLLKIKDQIGKDWIISKLSLVIDTSLEFSYSGLGDKICKNILSNNKAMSTFREIINTVHWYEIFEDFFSKMVWIFCSAPIIRT